MVDLDLELSGAGERAPLDQVVAVVGLAARGLGVEHERGAEAEILVSGSRAPASLAFATISASGLGAVPVYDGKRAA